jgi:imidazolonepropionase-like amidohydrolase
MNKNQSTTLLYPKYQTDKKLFVMKNLTLLILFCFTLVSVAAAQVPAPKQAEPIVVSGADIYTLSGNVIENGQILFEDGVITAIGQTIETPENAVVVDAAGKSVYPGLIDSYSQMGLYEIGAVDMTVDLNEEGDINPNIKPERAFNPESRHIAIARSAGVLTAVSTPGGGIISGQTAAMKMEGWTWDDMTLKSGVALRMNWPSPGNDDYKEELATLQQVFDDARAYLKAKEAGSAGGNRLATDTKLESMIPVLSGERPILVSANRADQIQDAITWAGNENLEIIILGGADAHLVSEHLVENDVPVILSAVLTSPDRDWEGYDARYELPAKLFRAGVKFAIGGTASAPYAHRLPYEAGAAIAYGLPADEALNAVTRYPAEILGLDDHIGTLEVGKRATFLITDGHPLEYNTSVEQVYVDGRESDMMDMHRQLYEKYKIKKDRMQSAD